MYPEVVRHGALSQALTMQLRIGNAIEVLRLLQAGVPVNSDELEALRGVADFFRSDEGPSAVMTTSAAMPDVSVEMVAAARVALDPDTTQALTSALRALTEALVDIADSRPLTASSPSIDDVVTQLAGIRQELAARTSVSPDEARSQLTACC